MIILNWFCIYVCQTVFNEQLQFPFKEAFETMGKLAIAFLIIGVCGFVNSLPAPQFPPTETITTEKAPNGSSQTTAKIGNEVTTVQTTPSVVSGSTKPSEHVKETTTNKSVNEAKTSTPIKSETTTTIQPKDEITDTGSTTLKSTEPTTKVDQKGPTSSSTTKQEVKGATTLPSAQKADVTTMPGHKSESSTSSSANKGQTTANPKVSNQKGTKTSTAYIDQGKVVIFNGICGPEGCEIEGDIYDELIPAGKKH